jgi:alpha-tubulin suppressor-like RCC1 family protein
MFGRNTPAVLGVKVDAVSENAPIKLEAKDLGAPKGAKFVHAACGRNHTILVGSDGQVWTAGANNLGQVRASGREGGGCEDTWRPNDALRRCAGPLVRASHCVGNLCVQARWWVVAWWEQGTCYKGWCGHHLLGRAHRVWER